MSTRNYVTQEQLLNTSYAMIALTSAFAIARVAIRVVRPKKLAIEDLLVFLSFIFFIAMSVLYIVATPAIFKISQVTTGAVPAYALLLEDARFVTKIFFANAIIFWFLLWTVKFSLLALYKRLFVGVENLMYIKVWWGVLVFCILSLIGCIVSNFTSCHSMHAWFSPGECTLERDVRAQIASLYYAFAVDVLSDFMIMLLPIRLIWYLQMPRAQKISVGALFCTGFICILFATIRVVQIGMKAGSNTTPSSSWLALWAVVEGSIAVIIGCCPAFAALYRSARKSHKVSYDARGYAKHPSNHSGEPSPPSINLKSIVSSKPKLRRNSLYYEQEGADSSQEELAKQNRGIFVTKTFSQEDERSTGDRV